MATNTDSRGGRENHLMDAKNANPDLIRVVLAGLPVASAIATPPGTVAITRRDVMNAGLDSLAVTRWLQPLGGFGGVAYLKPPARRLASEPVRPALHPISYFVVPLAALTHAAAGDAQDEGERATA
jgi:hypothetical protein